MSRIEDVYGHYYAAEQAYALRGSTTPVVTPWRVYPTTSTHLHRPQPMKLKCPYGWCPPVVHSGDSDLHR
jgi:hypothetical protein